ncbi:S1 family peptidase [Isoptericola sp. NEAU-Y5]|uniref:S1 family peptidase n=1 Tax=Isoptericola luteus TaxID=2879484 RepID=A0ABS7ZA71_9MICO|nr:S1 family peptidase [Isoptericola sp. NEAU-Y5]MCA5891963.1 S1 family peptidase [Isoptericola sp. NEAU-Y5]
MDLTEARKAKSELVDLARDLAERHGVPTPYGAGADVAPADMVRAPTLSLGIAPQEDGYGIAVRYRLGIPTARAFVRRVSAEIGPRADVRRTGRIRTLSWGSPRPPVATALAAGETDRVRPLRPGVSIAHVDVTAGTLGAFVVRADEPGARYALSNFHVLAGSLAAQPGDVVVQPGPADGGRSPADRVGTLAQVVPLAEGGPATVDAALALLDDGIGIDPAYPVGPVTTTAVAAGGETVEKVGRTTARTHGRVTAIELDDVVVGYGDDLGVLSFDGQIEVEATGDGPFSRGGDSGSLVYREDGVALGLLFAGSETGGANGTGLTYCNPIDAVLTALTVTLSPR